MVAWVNAQLEKPNSDRRVLVVKQLKNGRKDIAIGYWNKDFKLYDPIHKTLTQDGCWVVSGCQNILYWTELPKIPKDKE